MAAALLIAGLAVASAQAEPRRVAVVVGYGAYTSQPPLPICLRSAGAVGDALRTRGFEVTDLRDSSNGASSAQLGMFAKKLADPPAFVMIYVCGYATGLDGRPFILPVSAELVRPSDVLTQGMLAKSFIDLVRGAGSPALVILDTVPLPGSGAIGLGGLVHGDPGRPGLFVAGAAETDVAAPLTRLAAALISAIAAPEADAAGILDSLGRNLDPGVSLATAGSAPAKAWLSPPPPAPAEAPPAVAAAAAPAAPAPAAPAPAVVEPAPASLADGDRRRIQTALKQLGLYVGPVDGVFGAETAGAVRRFQLARGAEPSGRLDAGQTLFLLSLVAKRP